jgi:hypothetical protein
MPAISADIKELLIATELSVRPEDFVVVYLSQIKAISHEWFRHSTTRFAVVIQEPKSITMIIPRRKWLRMQNIFDKYEANGPWKVISLQLGASPVSVGYLAAVESALKDSKMPVIPISTLKDSHLLVPKADLPRAVRLLRELQESCRKNKRKK